jgi:hypothetical protein
MTSWLPEALCLGDAVNAMQKDVFSPIDRDSIRLAITMDDYLEGIPVLIEKSVEENNEITFFAAFSLSK